MIGKHILLSTLLTFSLSPLTSLAEDRIDHYQGTTVATLEEAVKVFSEQNQKLQSLIESETLTAESLNAIHQLTYTLENALGKVNHELNTLADTLEEVHLASETGNAEKTKVKAAEFLSVSRQVID